MFSVFRPKNARKPLSPDFAIFQAEARLGGFRGPSQPINDGVRGPEGHRKQPRENIAHSLSHPPPESKLRKQGIPPKRQTRHEKLFHIPVKKQTLCHHRGIRISTCIRILHHSCSICKDCFQRRHPTAAFPAALCHRDSRQLWHDTRHGRGILPLCSGNRGVDKDCRQRRHGHHHRRRILCGESCCRRHELPPTVRLSPYGLQQGQDIGIGRPGNHLGKLCP